GRADDDQGQQRPDECSGDPHTALLWYACRSWAQTTAFPPFARRLSLRGGTTPRPPCSMNEQDSVTRAPPKLGILHIAYTDWTLLCRLGPMKRAAARPKPGETSSACASRSVRILPARCCSLSSAQPGYGSAPTTRWERRSAPAPACCPTSFAGA